MDKKGGLQSFTMKLDGINFVIIGYKRLVLEYNYHLKCCIIVGVRKCT